MSTGRPDLAALAARAKDETLSQEERAAAQLEYDQARMALNATTDSGGTPPPHPPKFED